LKRLPFNITRISSDGRPRSDGARTRLDASEMVFWPTKNEGTTFLIWSSMFAAGCARNSVAEMTSIGDAESVTVRSRRRVPVITTCSTGLLSSVAGCAAAVCATALPPGKPASESAATTRVSRQPRTY
jgi:hypothetical protein